MTPAQRKYDLELAASMIRMANWIAPRSRKVSDTLMLGAQRLQALAGLPIDLPPPSVAYGEPPDVQPPKKPSPRQRRKKTGEG